MAWMTAGPVKVLMGIGRCGVQVSANFAVTIDYLNVKKRILVVDLVCSNLMCGSKELQKLKKSVSFSSP